MSDLPRAREHNAARAYPRPRDDDVRPRQRVRASVDRAASPRPSVRPGTLPARASRPVIIPRRSRRRAPASRGRLLRRRKVGGAGRRRRAPAGARGGARRAGEARARHPASSRAKVRVGEKANGLNYASNGKLDKSCLCSPVAPAMLSLGRSPPLVSNRKTRGLFRRAGKPRPNPLVPVFRNRRPILASAAAPSEGHNPPRGRPVASR